MDQRTYSSSDLIVTLGGDRIGGWIDGEYMTVSYDSDFYTYVNGADGEVTRVKNEKRMASITIRLLQTSPSNDVLSGYLNADLIANIPVPFVVKDLNGNTIFTGVQTSIIKTADFSFGTEGTAREWSLKAANLVGFLGGNFIG
jgi:hypothetical protein